MKFQCTLQLKMLNIFLNVCFFWAKAKPSSLPHESLEIKISIYKRYWMETQVNEKIAAKNSTKLDTRTADEINTNKL